VERGLRAAAELKKLSIYGQLGQHRG
jgi:hypothetical protein